MKKQLLALALTIGMLTTASISADSDAWRSPFWADRGEDEGGVREVAAAPVRATGDVVEGTGKILTGRWSRNSDTTDWQGRPDEGGVEEVAKAPFRAARDVTEGTGNILRGNW